MNSVFHFFLLNRKRIKHVSWRVSQGNVYHWKRLNTYLLLGINISALGRKLRQMNVKVPINSYTLKLDELHTLGVDLPHEAWFPGRVNKIKIKAALGLGCKNTNSSKMWTHPWGRNALANHQLHSGNHRCASGSSHHQAQNLPWEMEKLRDKIKTQIKGITLNWSFGFLANNKST